MSVPIRGFPIQVAPPTSTIAIVKYRDLVKRLKADSWEIVAIRGSHQQWKHPLKRGRVTVAGHPGDDIHPRTLKSIRRQAGWEE